MQFTIISTIFMAAAAIASPAAAPPAMEAADLVARTGGSSGGSTKTCSGNTKQVCCNGALNCVVQVLGSQCSGGVYCCNTGSSTGSLISINALNCVKIL
ncbi:hypothetical protein PG994_006529 [Apiospora phragmitis]|uniref:Hydrophobin n=1 Tax=Apiospora phragmitis TaxID=2905665 RepID=A0ABR1VFB0_9PEZI